MGKNKFSPQQNENGQKYIFNKIQNETKKLFLDKVQNEKFLPLSAPGPFFIFGILWPHVLFGRSVGILLASILAASYFAILCIVLGLFEVGIFD
ncbi:unnamed protein product [Meloidogyne enterolobii]|uniref:Uncharacterized protein n=1 Tax=Meloidogyne enterolobii TaxID=390850 RepID=A0ACB0ZPX3_MELEN